MPKLCSKCQKKSTQYEDMALCEECNEKEFEEGEQEFQREFKEKLCKEIGEKIREVWGNSYKVAEVAFRVILRHAGELGGDYDDQIKYAREIGVLAGEMKDKTPDEFIATFKEKVLNEK